MSDNGLKHIAVIGSTGTLGMKALEVIEAHPDRYTVEVLTANENAQLLAKLAFKFKPNVVVIAKEVEYSWLKDQLFDHGIKVYCGQAAIADIVQMEGIDMVLNSQSGISGIEPSLKAIEAGKQLVLGNTESLIVAGEILTQVAHEKKAIIFPLRLGHISIFQGLVGEYQNNIKRLFLTDSLSFESYSSEKLLTQVTREKTPQKRKSIVNDATWMTKGFEIMESKWLYDVQPENVSVLYHPEGVIQGMLQYEDGTIKTIIADVDIKMPIQFALSFPERIRTISNSQELSDAFSLSFTKTKHNEKRNITLCEIALREGGTASAILNAANDVAVEGFLKGELSLSEIPDFNEECLIQFKSNPKPTLEDYLSCDAETRAKASELLKPKVS